MPQGVVSRIVPGTVFGYISPVNGGTDIFFHANSCNHVFEDIRPGAVVDFNIGANGKGPCAVDVQILESLSPLAKEVTGFVSSWVEANKSGIVATEIFGDIKLSGDSAVIKNGEIELEDIVRVTVISYPRWVEPLCVAVAVVFRNRATHVVSSNEERIQIDEEEQISEPEVADSGENGQSAQPLAMLEPEPQNPRPPVREVRQIGPLPSAKKQAVRVPARVPTNWGEISPTDFVPFERRNQRFALYDFAWFPNKVEKLKELKELAQEEIGEWDYLYNPKGEYPVLERYLRYTFIRVLEQGKVLESANGRHAAFNTGLRTTKQESLYALFELNHNGHGREKWRLTGFRKKSHDYFVHHFIGRYPPIATYIDDPSDIVYNVNYSIAPNIEHIVQRLSRFPEPYRGNEHYALTAIRDVIHGIKERVHENYRIAIPQWYRPGAGQVSGMQLLIPVRASSTEQADVALTLERVGQGYRAATVLSIDQAYTNARLIARPDSDWLKPLRSSSLLDSDSGDF